MRIANKDFPVASIANSVLYRMIRRSVVEADDVISIYKSQTFPTTGFGVANNLESELATKIRNMFF